MTVLYWGSCVIYSNTDDMDGVAFSRAGPNSIFKRKISNAYFLETMLLVDPNRISLLLCHSQQVNTWSKIVGLFLSNQSVTFTTICVPHFSIFHPLQRRKLSLREIGSLLSLNRDRPAKPLLPRTDFDMFRYIQAGTKLH